MRKSCVVVSMFALILLAFMSACGGGNSIAVSLTAPSSTSVPAGSTVSLTASVSSDSKNGGVSWSISAGCGTLTNTTTTSATYNAPAAATLNADCTATITATSVSDTAKSKAVTLTAKAITVTATSSSGSTTTFDSGAGPVTLTASLNNEASGANDSVTWILVSTPTSSIRRPAKSIRPQIISPVSCGSITPFTGTTTTWTPPTQGGCTATITATSSINTHQVLTTVFTVNAISVNITAPASAITEFVHQGNISLSATIQHDAASGGLAWNLSNPACGSVVPGTPTTSATYVPPPTPSAACSTTVIATSNTDSTEAAISPSITINPNIGVAWNGTQPTTADEGATATLAATISNDLVPAQGLKWAVSPSSCGSVSPATGTSVTFTAASPLTASCNAIVTVTSAADATESAQTSIAVTAASVTITSTSPTPVAASAVVPFTATLNHYGGTMGITWTVSPSSCGTIVAGTPTTSATYTAPAEANLPSACTATVSAAPAADPTKTVTQSVTANPITIGAITSNSATPPSQLGQGSAWIPLTVPVSFDANGGADILWSITQTGTCGTLGHTWGVGSSISNDGFHAATSVTAPCAATITATSQLDPSRQQSTTITVMPLTVTITTPATSTANVNEGAQQPLIATVIGDTLNPPGSVYWTIVPTAPATSCGTLSVTSAVQVPTGTQISFTAPAPPILGCSATVTATSATDSTKIASVVLTVVPPVISVTYQNPGPWSIDASNSNGPSTLAITANIQNDPGAGISWNVSNNGSASCLLSSATATGTNSSTLTITANLSSALTANCSATITATSNANTSKTAVGTLTVYPISVNINPGGNQNYAQGASNPSFSATVNNDALGSPGQASTGVTWSLTVIAPATSCGSIDNSTANPVTYIVPTLTTQCTVDLVATSNADGTKSNFDSITVQGPVSALVITPANLEIPQGMATMPYTMAFNNNNVVSGGTPPYAFAITGLPDGLSADTSGNITGTPTAAASTSVQVTVKDSASTPLSQSTSFTLPVIALSKNTNNNKLSGQYACVIHVIRDSPITVGTANLSVGARVAAFNADGEGHITGGEADMNDPKDGYQSGIALTGSYAVGTDNRGYIMIGPNSSNQSIYALAAGLVYGGAYTEFRLTEMDDAGGSTIASNNNGGGLCFKQYDKTDTTTLTGEAISGGYVFLQNGEDSGGYWETSVGSLFINSTTRNFTGVMDSASGSKVSLDQAITGSMGLADSWGRVAMTVSTAGISNAVIYITNQALGQGVYMTTASHATAGNDLLFGQIRAQNATDIAKTYPITGPFVMYTTGLDAETSGSVKSMIDHGTGSSSGATTVTIDGSAQNDGGTVKLNDSDVLNKAMTYTADATTGRVTFGSSGDVMYLYDTNEAVVLMADVGHGDSSTYQNMVGWLETQTVPTSGVWAISDISANYFMGDMYSPITSNNSGGDKTGVVDIASDGTVTVAQDNGSQNYDSWDEGMGGNNGQSVTGAFVLDPTIDPNGTLGVFDINVTQGTTATTQVYCFATSVDTATKSTTWGRALCMDAPSSSPSISIVQQ